MRRGIMSGKTDKIIHKKGGCPYGSHRVIEPPGALPQPACKLNNDPSILWDNEIQVDVDTLNIDSASFHEIKCKAGGNAGKIKGRILDIVNARGKMQNPVTGSGGMFVGTVAETGTKIEKDLKIRKGDKIASLVSLSLTPLFIEEIVEIKTDIDQVKIKGKAILFESGIYTPLPRDIPDTLALAVLDVAGAPARTARLVKKGDTVVILGATGKSGILCAYKAKKKAGNKGTIIGIGHSDDKIAILKSLEICDIVIKQNASDAVSCYEEIKRITGGKLADLVIDCVNVADSELASILMCRNGGTVYFFSMATSFTKAALGAEGAGKDVTMIIGNGYTEGHAEMALNILRESAKIRRLYESIYM